MEYVEIREVMPEDAEELIACTKKAGGETDNLTFGKEGFPVTVEQEREYLWQMHCGEKSVHYGAWKDGKLVGNASLSGLPRRMSHVAEMALMVVKAQWNRGIGGMLLKKLIEYARRTGIEIIKLEVRSDNAGAIHLYEKYGFKRAGRLPAYFKIGTEYIDFDIMCLDLRKIAGSGRADMRTVSEEGNGES